MAPRQFTQSRSAASLATCEIFEVPLFADEPPGERYDVKVRRLAAEIHDRAAVCSVEDLLKLTQGAIYDEISGARLAGHVSSDQVAHIDSSLGAYHLHLGPETHCC